MSRRLASEFEDNGENDAPENALGGGAGKTSCGEGGRERGERTKEREEREIRWRARARGGVGDRERVRVCKCERAKGIENEK
eukprot:6176575-Pleurochrysis_carterae.AAC.4